MAGKLRVVRRRIRSVQSTKKITRAMELIAASRIVRAQQRVEAARPYADQIGGVIANLAAGGAATDSPLLRPLGDIQRVGYVVVTSDRGLAGGYNANVIRAAETHLRSQVEAGRQYVLVTVGRKALGYFRYRRYDIRATYTGMSDLPSYEDARQVVGEVMRLFESGELDVVYVVYTRFLSLGTQRPTIAQLMPVERPDVTAEPGAPAAGEPVAHEPVPGEPVAAYEFEPEAGEILARLLPRAVEARMFAFMLEASASEHAARQRAMKSATDNAEDLIKSLTRIADRARQEEITSEIMEIVGGAEALRQPTGASHGVE
jgi:F-type H+-transporting ATPase subunit gamma